MAFTSSAFSSNKFFESILLAVGSLQKMLMMLFFQMQNIVFCFLQSSNNFCFNLYTCQKVGIQSKQCRRIYICLFCVAKILVGKSQTLELHPLDAGLASPNEKVYGSNTLSAIGKQLFPVKKENSDD